MTTPGRVRVQPVEQLPSELEAVIRSFAGDLRPLPRLFTVLGRDPRLLKALLRGGLLDPGNLTLREREIVIHRVTAACGADYEWGLHAAHFAARAALDPESLASLATGASTDPAWSTSEAVLIDLCDALHDSATVDAALWSRLRTRFSDEAILEAVMVVGYYRMISYLVNVLDLPLEPGTTGIEHTAPAGSASPSAVRGA
jgi:alkylhydroperoxidase family enzyme